MNKKIVLYVLTAIVTVIVSYMFFFKTTVTLKERNKFNVEKIKSEIEISNNVISMYSFSNITDVNWISASKVKIIGTHSSSGKGTYLFDLKNYKLNKTDIELNKLALNEEEYTILESNDENKLLMKLDEESNKKLYLYTNSKLIYISDVKYTTKEMYLVSKDKSKLLYVDKDGYIDTFSLNNFKTKKKIVKLDKDTINNFFENIKISDDGGFFLVKTKVENKIKFNIYGADSGRTYGKNILGVNPVFSPKSNKIGFYYSGDLVSEKLVNTRVGVINLKTKKIIYYDSALKNDEFVSSIYWLNDNSTLVYRYKDEIKSYICLLNTSKMQKKKYEIRGEFLKEFGVIIFEDHIYWGEKSDGIILNSLSYNNFELKTYKNIRLIGNENNEKIAINTDRGLMISTENGIKFISDTSIITNEYTYSNLKVISVSKEGTLVIGKKEIEGEIVYEIIKL
ncbi:hypothetical protein [Helicovermis profundi]|uniref:Uncharacterized protein n=1 Tax=Helicovermis profundi TaxID=3065157 RepID=A0AAU9ECK3_9FIRM|nr:hypothetical protein HLPR_20280 [Clostridia bacterium S502]